MPTLERFASMLKEVKRLPRLWFPHERELGLLVPVVVPLLPGTAAVAAESIPVKNRSPGTVVSAAKLLTLISFTPDSQTLNSRLFCSLLDQSPTDIDGVFI